MTSPPWAVMLKELESDKSAVTAKHKGLGWELKSQAEHNL